MHLEASAWIHCNLRRTPNVRPSSEKARSFLSVIVRLIRQTNDALGITSIVVTHDVAEMEKLADLSYLISNGKVVAHGTPQELQRDSSDTVRQFMQGLADGPVPFHFPGPQYAEQLQEMAHA